MPYQERYFLQLIIQHQKNLSFHLLCFTFVVLPLPSFRFDSAFKQYSIVPYTCTVYERYMYLVLAPSVCDVSTYTYHLLNSECMKAAQNSIQACVLHVCSFACICWMRNICIDLLSAMQILAPHFNHFQFIFWLRVTYESPIPETHLRSILSIWL